MAISACERATEAIAIIGSGLRFPGDVQNPTQFWDLLQQPRDVRTSIPADRFNVDGFYHPLRDDQGTSRTRHGYFLNGNHQQFDAEFFGINPVEANSMDPQQRMLLEVVYESIEAAGLDMDALRGSPTAAYVGLMSVDYNDMLNRDTSDYPPYVAAGTSRSMMSNRLSYFFDWRGPSMTIDTACSSSLVAVHLAIQSLRAGESELAIAAGANLILGPEQFIIGSHMKMLSPDGRSFWCDDRANGYARGEGVAAIVLKPLSAAIADGDHIESVIVETGLNQDGRTQGTTVPSASAQATLIQQTYKRAGLDLTKPSDRPQYFEAHGTGTPTGDPIEIEAIHRAFFANIDASNPQEKLHCGSVKTVIGHTEGTAGLAGLIKTSLALQHGVMPPDLLFKSVAPAIRPFYNNLKIPTIAEPWPTLAPGSTRRASVNSFGFGGTNAHCILESFHPVRHALTARLSSYHPFVFSAASETSLSATLKAHSGYLELNPMVDIGNLSHTVCARRKAFPLRIAFSASNVEDLRAKLNFVTSAAADEPVFTASPITSHRQILGIFTGQGAQWAGMASCLMKYPGAEAVIDELECSLAGLPDPPSWSLKAELSAESSCSRITNATITQPACTAIQILLIKMLRAAGIRFSAVVGHSSGEIAAAYAAGYLSARDAVRIAYYRGVHLSLVGGKNGEHGSMLAIGASYEEAQSICDQAEFRGKIGVAASNSGSSVTLSGDTSAIKEVEAMFKATKRFARLLRVDNAYHSHHMIRCSEAITDSLRACKIESQRPSTPSCAWVSSVYKCDIAQVTDDLNDQYWHSNTIGEVLFSQALENAVRRFRFDLAVEIGAHPALKGPALQVIEHISGHTVPYTGTLSRNTEDDRAFSDCLGYIWANLTNRTVDFAGYNQFINATDPPVLLKGLPVYPWDHARAFWHESRLSRAYRSRSSRHDLLGLRNADYSAEQMSWKNSLVPEKLSWISDHRIQGQMIFPGAAYIVSAFEAALQVAGEQTVKLIELSNLKFVQPLVFTAEDSRMEVLMSLHSIKRQHSSITANFTYHSVAKETPGPMALNAHCKLKIVYGNEDGVILKPLAQPHFGMTQVDSERIYASFADHGYQYTGHFKALTSVTRRFGVASGQVRVPGATSETSLLIHPATLDAGMHSIMVAHSYPGDGQLAYPLLPTEIMKISLNLPETLKYASHQHLKFTSLSLENGKHTGGEMELSSVDSAGTILRLEGLHTKPMLPATPANDAHMFSETVWGPAYPLLQSDSDSDRSHATQFPARDLIASAAEQLSHRYPNMHILGLGSGIADEATHFVSELDNTFASYTHTEISDECLNLTSTILHSMNDRVTVKKLSPLIDASDQGLTERCYDLVVAFSIPSEELELRQTLNNVRRLIKPGGFFLCSQYIDMSGIDPRPVAPLCVDSDRGDFPRPASSLLQRSRILENYGFADATLSSHHSDDGQCQKDSCITFIQAIDVRIQFLRVPLGNAATQTQVSAEHIVIIGGATIATSACANEIMGILPAYSNNKVVRVSSISSLLIHGCPLGASVLVLQDHNKHLFEDLDQTVLEGMNILFRHSKNILWVTHGYKHNAPHARMFVAFARCLAQEMTHVRLQTVDLPSPDALDASLIAQDFLRLLGTGLWEEQGLLNDVLWSVEPEVSYEDGRAFIPRVKPNKTLDNRLNSSRRTIVQDIELKDEIVSLRTEIDKYVLAATVGGGQLSIRSNDIAIEVTHSFLKAVRVDRCGFFFLLLGVDMTSRENVIALSSTLSSRVHVPRQLVRCCPSRAGTSIEYLRAIFYSLISCAILRGLAPADSVLILGPDDNIANFLPTFAAALGIRVLLSGTTEDRKASIRTPSDGLSEKLSAPLHDVNLARVICWTKDEWTADMRGETPIGVSIEDKENYTVARSSPVDSMSNSRVSAALDRVLNQLNLTKPLIAPDGASIRPLTGVIGSSVAAHSTIIVDWKSQQRAQIRVQSIDQAELFMPDKTYWLIGLTGNLGLSLCQWMISKGAKHIALSSRRPDIDPGWFAHFDSLGAMVKVFPSDVTDYESVDSTLGTIAAKMPPVAGVCHGAMVLQDALIHDLDIKRVEQVLRPKVNGAVNLDKALCKHSLDFFIMLSSIATITGNPGQSIYAAANGFLAALSAQRRARGDCASTINLGAILGTGATRTLTLAQQQSLERAGVRWTSEQNFHSAFAEAVVASRASPTSSGEFTTGVRLCHADEQNKPKHADNPVFSHMLLHNTSTKLSVLAPAMKSVRSQLLRASTGDEVFLVLEAFLTTKLRKALQMSQDSTVIDKSADTLGIDSLIAVEMRSWFLKELNVDLPLLTIIGGNNMRHVVEFCCAGIDSAMTPLLDIDPDRAANMKKRGLQDGNGETAARLKQNSGLPPPKGANMLRVHLSDSTKATTTHVVASLPGHPSTLVHGFIEKSDDAKDRLTEPMAIPQTSIDADTLNVLSLRTVHGGDQDTTSCENKSDSTSDGQEDVKGAVMGISSFTNSVPQTRISPDRERWFSRMLRSLKVVKNQRISMSPYNRR